MGPPAFCLTTVNLHVFALLPAGVFGIVHHFEYPQPKGTSDQLLLQQTTLPAARRISDRPGCLPAHATSRETGELQGDSAAQDQGYHHPVHQIHAAPDQ